MILPGVSIGNGVTIAANSVVTHYVADYALTGEVPAKIIRIKFEPQEVELLNKVSWWDWTEDIIKERIEDFYLTAQQFIEKI